MSQVLAHNSPALPKDGSSVPLHAQWKHTTFASHRQGKIPLQPLVTASSVCGPLRVFLSTCSFPFCSKKRAPTVRPWGRSDNNGASSTRVPSPSAGCRSGPALLGVKPRSLLDNSTTAMLPQEDHLPHQFPSVGHEPVEVDPRRGLVPVIPAAVPVRQVVIGPAFRVHQGPNVAPGDIVDD